MQIGYGEAKPKSLNKPRQGHLAKAGRLVRHLREFRATNVDEYNVGQELKVDLLLRASSLMSQERPKVAASPVLMKRHNFRGGPRTHGQSDRARAPGSIGAGTTPGRVFKGTRMAGRMGNQRVTVQNLQVVEIIPDQNLLLVRGSVPGPKNGLLYVRQAVKVQEGA